ncbi:MAG: hypothetical protein B7Z81_04050 [Acidocella sp. 20-61-6]|nr:MAG: hypothetical protein B7Z81_04050 [Acidocella sp. 20-61-6]
MQYLAEGECGAQAADSSSDDGDNAATFKVADVVIGTSEAGFMAHALRDQAAKFHWLGVHA